MEKVWITYSWEDNKDQSVDFVAQELEKIGLEVYIDKWTIVAGKGLWEQIENYIADKDKCHGWIFYMTHNSLKSKPCMEEFAYALDRALSSRGSDFPLIGLSPINIERSLLPSGIKTRLYVSLRDDDWKERIKSSIENRTPSIFKPTIDPFTIDFHQYKQSDTEEPCNVIEVRPRAGVWSPSFIGVPLNEKELLEPWFKYGVRGICNQGVTFSYPQSSESLDKQWWLMSANNEVNTTISIYLICKPNIWPTKIAFGNMQTSEQYIIDIDKSK